jgi:hypothetical protein
MNDAAMERVRVPVPRRLMVKMVRCCREGCGWSYGRVYPDEERLDGVDDEKCAWPIRLWVAWRPSVADTPSDDSRPDHVHAVERPNECPR